MTSEFWTVSFVGGTNRVGGTGLAFQIEVYQVPGTTVLYHIYRVHSCTSYLCFTYVVAVVNRICDTLPENHKTVFFRFMKVPEITYDYPTSSIQLYTIYIVYIAILLILFTVRFTACFQTSTTWVPVLEIYGNQPFRFGWSTRVRPYPDKPCSTCINPYFYTSQVRVWKVPDKNWVEIFAYVLQVYLFTTSYRTVKLQDTKNTMGFL